MGSTWKVATYNVNSIRARLPVIAEWLEWEQPDVAALQETKVQDDKFPWQELAALGYHAVYKGEKAYNGVAILTKSQPSAIRFGLDGWGLPDEARLLALAVDGVHIVNTYIPQGREAGTEYFQYKLGWIRHMRSYFENYYKAEQPVIWLGDFNVAPAPADVHSPEKLLGSVGYHPEEHLALQHVQDWGFTDVFRQHVTEDKQFTFWDYRVPNAVKRGMGWRIDHIWATPVMTLRSLNAWVDVELRLGNKPSDHAPLLAEFSR